MKKIDIKEIWFQNSTAKTVSPYGFQETPVIDHMTELLSQIPVMLFNKYKDKGHLKVTFTQRKCIAPDEIIYEHQIQAEEMYGKFKFYIYTDEKGLLLDTSCKELDSCAVPRKEIEGFGGLIAYLFNNIDDTIYHQAMNIITSFKIDWYKWDVSHYVNYRIRDNEFCLEVISELLEYPIIFHFNIFNLSLFKVTGTVLDADFKALGGLSLSSSESYLYKFTKETREIIVSTLKNNLPHPSELTDSVYFNSLKRLVLLQRDLSQGKSKTISALNEIANKTVNTNVNQENISNVMENNYRVIDSMQKNILIMKSEQEKLNSIDEKIKEYLDTYKNEEDRSVKTFIREFTTFREYLKQMIDTQYVTMVHLVQTTDTIHQDYISRAMNFALNPSNANLPQVSYKKTSKGVNGFLKKIAHQIKGVS